MKNLISTLNASLLGAIALGGCASTQTVLSTDTDESVKSSKSADAVALCLVDRNRSKAERISSVDGDQVVLLKNGYNAVAMTFTVSQDGDGSRVNIRRQFPIVGVKHRQCY